MKSQTCREAGTESLGSYLPLPLIDSRAAKGSQTFCSPVCFLGAMVKMEGEKI